MACSKAQNCEMLLKMKKKRGRMLTKRCGFPIIVSAKAHDMQKHKVYTKIEKCSDQRRSNACNPGSKANLSSNEIKQQ